MPGESLVLKAHQHWVVLVKPLLIPVLLIAAAIAYDVLYPVNWQLVTLAIVAISLLWFIVVYIRWRSRGFTITDRRVLLDTGVFSRTSSPVTRAVDASVRRQRSAVEEMSFAGR